MSIYPDSIPRCQHIKVNGIQCGSPALRNQKYCYFHNQWREARINLYSRQHVRGSLTFPVLEDANSIQISLMQIMNLIAAGQIDSKTAGLLLYALQTASNNLSRISFEPYPPKVVIDPDWVADTSLGENAWHNEDFEEDPDEGQDDAEPEEQDQSEEENSDDENPGHQNPNEQNSDTRSEDQQDEDEHYNLDECVKFNPREPFDTNKLTNAQVEAIFREADAFAETEQNGRCRE